MSNDVLLFIGDVGLLIGFVFILLFSIRFFATSKWRENRTGLALGSFMGSIASILGYVTFVAFSGGFPGAVFVRLALYWWFAVSSIYFFVRLIRTQRWDQRVRSEQVLDSEKGTNNDDG